MAVQLFLPGKKKITLAIFGTIAGMALTIYLIRTGTPAKEAAEIAAVVLGSLWAYIAAEGGRDIARTWKKPD